MTVSSWYCQYCNSKVLNDTKQGPLLFVLVVGCWVYLSPKINVSLKVQNIDLDLDLVKTTQWTILDSLKNLLDYSKQS